MKFYWNERYPEAIYVVGFDVLGRDILYALSSSNEREPANGQRLDGLGWTATIWPTNEESLKRNRFEFIGKL